MIYGDFEVKLNSNYEWDRGTTIEITGIRYEIIKEIIEAINPILEKEVEMIKNGSNKDE